MLTCDRTLFAFKVCDGGYFLLGDKFGVSNKYSKTQAFFKKSNGGDQTLRIFDMLLGEFYKKINF